MQTTTTAYDSAISASVRKVKAKAELYSSSALAATYTESDKIINFDIQRVGEDGKFFGFGICHRLNLHLIDVQRQLNITTANSIKMSIGVGADYVGFPTFNVSEVHRDEKTNELSITAYDALYPASEKTVNQLTLTKPYTIKDFCDAIGILLGVSVSGHTGFTLSYENGANFDGDETIREALDDVAEATQTIYYLDANNTLVFKKLDKDGSAVTSIDKAKYITLKSGIGHRLQTICSATELGDNVSESTTLVGSTQYVRDNAFWELREDIATLVHNALTAIGNISIDVFDCTWRGNPALEVGDKITLITKDNKTICSYLLNDTIKYDGSLSEQTMWKYDVNNQETESNPTTLGDVLNKTKATVDKVSRQITLLATDVENKIQNIQKAVKQVDVEYYLSTSSEAAIGGTWSTIAPAWESGKYMWSRTKVTYIDDTTSTSNETCIAGAKGENGKDGVDGAPGKDGTDGRGITSVITQYYVSSSETELLDGEWIETQPKWEDGQYIWTRSKIIYNNPTSTEYTTEVCDAAWSQINKIQGQQKINTTDIAQLKVDKDSISASVSNITETQTDLSNSMIDMQNTINEQNQSNAAQFETLTNKVDATMTSEQVQLAISSELSKGVSKVTTSTGFTFDNTGLTISRSDSEIDTNINEDGMSICKSNQEVLTADNTGVYAINLTANQYLIIGNNSRFGDYEVNRTGCFYIGD